MLWMPVLYKKSEDKRIVIKAKADSASLFLTIDNTFDSIVRQNKQGRYLSTKKDGSGLGLPSVRSIVERYDGSISINHDGGMFRVSIMLNLL